MRFAKIYLLCLLAPWVVLLLPVSSCSKTGYTFVQATADSASQITIANDEMNISYEVDQAVNEAILATGLSHLASGNTGSIGSGAVLYTTISNVIIDTSHVADSALIHLTYYGKNADQTKGRTGVVTVQLARDTAGKIIPWGNTGATATINFNQYEVIVLSNNVSVWMNGNLTLTNVSGGLLKQPANMWIPVGDSLQDKVNGSIVFTYNDNVANIQTWTWAINQNRWFSMSNSVLTCLVTGDSAVNGNSGISTSGTTRSGMGFNTQITVPLVQSISSLYLLSNPLTGEKIIRGITEPVTIDYGVDSLGNSIQNSSPYGYKLSWVHSGAHAVSIVKY